MPIPTPVDVPEQMIQTPNAGALAAVQASLAETAAATPEPAQAAPVETEFVDPAAAAAPADPAATPDPAAVVDPAADPAKPAETAPVDPVVDPAVPAVEPVVEAPKRPSDEFGTLPETYKKETRDRFEAVKTKFDEEHERRTRAETAASTWHETIASTGATPEQFGELLLFAKDVNSGTPEGLRNAYETVSRQQAALAKALGLPATGYDPLDDHPDLKERVENSVDFTRDDALALAAARSQGKLQQSATQRIDEQTQAQRAHQDGINAVAALGQQLRAANAAEFQAKMPALEVIIESVIQNRPAREWPAAIQQAYNRLPIPAAAPQPPVPRVPNTVRPGSSPAALDKKPGSALEAVAMSLARGGG